MAGIQKVGWGVTMPGRGSNRVSGGLKGVIRGLNEWWGSRHVGWGPTGDPDDLKKKKRA